MKLLASLTAALLVTTGTAFAARPASLAGTTWNLQVNQEVETLAITTQGGPGAPGAANCRIINGIIRNVAPIRGFYCPSTGKIFFVHTNVSTGAPVRVFSGYVSDEAIGMPLYLGGIVSVVNAAFGDLGEYNFASLQ
ncbi:MAG: hypothetical protein AB7O32_01995 [Vicinamibacterales bacterium]